MRFIAILLTAAFLAGCGTNGFLKHTGDGPNERGMTVSNHFFVEWGPDAFRGFGPGLGP